MSTSQQKYKIRPGTVDSGKEYEVKVVALLSLRCVLYDVDEMWIASNADGVGDFDDIILHVKTAENTDGITFMMQLKHRDNRDNIKVKEFLNSGDFVLKKYSEDISKLQRSISSNSKPTIIKHLGQFDNIYFVFFTNRGESKNGEILLNINNPDGPISFLKNVLNTNITVNSLFGFDLKKLPEIASNSNFKNVFLLANQLSSESIDKIIADTIKNMVDPVGLTQIDVKDMAQNFMQYIKDWAKGTLGGHYYLTKQDVLTKISDLFLAHYAVRLGQNQFNFYDCNKKNIWNQVMCHETITIVDSSDVLEFLVKYIGSEVKKHCDVSNNKFWSEHLYGQAQSLFYQTNPDLKKQMHQVVGNIGKITLLDVYKCLWMVKKLPLLLEVKKMQDFENILHVLKLTNYSFKAVVVNNSTEKLPSNQVGTMFCTLQDLHSGYKDVILKLPIRLQGRAGVALGSVVDENMHQYITCKDIINILLDNFNIGNTLEQLPAYFITRSFIKTFISTQVLRDTEDDVFLLDNRSDRYFSLFPQNDFNACKLEDVTYNNVDNYKVVLFHENDNLLEWIERLKSTKKAIHHLFISDANYLEWKWTLGSTKNLRLFQMQLEDMHQKDIAPYFSNGINIVSDGPGMGKTTLMNFIEHQAPTDKWVLKLNLNAHQWYYRKGNWKNSKLSAEKHLRYFNDFLRNKDSYNVEISQKVFEKLLDAKSVIVLMDGFDEISVSYKDEVTELAKCLCTKGYHIWLTARQHMKSHLEEKFDAFSLSLKPFDTYDQTQFFTKYFNKINNDLIQQNSEIPLGPFIEHLLEASKNHLRDEDAKFAGIPLQSKLLADFFNDDCRNYLNSKGVITLNKNFDLLDLYQNFIDKKLDILCKKFGEYAADTHSMFQKYQFHFALKLVFSFNDLQLDIENEFNNDYKKEPKIIQLLQRDGVIMVDEKLNISCTHRTFAEYLAALWLTENINSESEKVKETVDVLTAMRFGGNYEFLFIIFDRILTNNYPLHSAIVNSRTEEVIAAITINPDVLKDVDDGNRSVVHVIALYSIRFPRIYNYGEFIQNQEFNSDIMLDVINTVPDGVIMDIEMDVLGYSPFDYALAYGSLTVANKLLDILKSPIFKLNKGMSLNKFSLTYCAELNYEKLIQTLLPYFASRDLLLNRIGRDSNITTYITETWNTMFDENLQNVVKKLYKNKNITLLELLHSADGYPYTGYANNFYSDLRHAVISGTVENVKTLLSEGQNINKKDLDDYTILHYAILHENATSTEILIDSGANVNAQTFSSKETPLHFAIGNTRLNSNNRHRIVAKMLANNANTNIQNINGDSPLHYASFNGYTDIITLLIEKVANTNLKTVFKQTTLHFELNMYAEFFQNNIDKLHLGYGADSDQLFVAGNTPLHLAKNGDIARILISNGAEVNAKNNNGETPFNCACIRGYSSTVRELIAHSADVNQQDRDGHTALHCLLFRPFKYSPGNAKSDILKLLLDNDADVNIQNKYDETALFVAIKNKFDQSLIELFFPHLAKGYNIVLL